jgi:hypothetical protein
VNANTSATFTNNDDANKMFERQHREGWALTV